MAKKDIKVSIIIPVYNVEKYLERCIESVLAQTLKEIEVFLVDDGSSDRSWEIIQTAGKKDARIVAIQQENAGAAVARNRGLELAQGEYIGFVDSDDYVDADYFESLYWTAKNNDADIARAYVQSEIETSDDYQIAHSTSGYDRYYNVASKVKVLENKLYLTSSNWLAVYRRALLDDNKIRFADDIRTGQDNIFNLHVSYYANKVVFVEKETFYHMNRRDGSLMTGYNFTVDGLLSRILVIAETVRFLNAVESYDARVYAFRIKDVFEFFHSRLIKIQLTDEEIHQLAEALIPLWREVKHKDEVRHALRHEARFINSLESEAKFAQYVTRTIPLKKTLSKVESHRKEAADKIRQSGLLYRVLRPPVHVLRKLNKLVGKLLS